MNDNSTICAIATPAGSCALSLIRVSGRGTFDIISRIFKPSGSGNIKFEEHPNTVFHGIIIDEREIIDEVLMSVFKAPHSYTGEDSAEITCHGSQFIQQEIIHLLLRSGATMAQPGEYTLRAFLNKKMDLSQAEAVADVIASNSRASHNLAMKQMRGGFSSKISQLREQLVHFSSLLELELDFSEEDVEFAKRKDLFDLLVNLETELAYLIESFATGNVMKNGIPVAIIGKPNVGKSTLLNILLNEDKAIVSEIPGTTRDAIEDTIVIQGISFRFIDTAGLRMSNDIIESKGIEKTLEKIEQAGIILYLFDISQTTISEILTTADDFMSREGNRDKKLIIIANMIDKLMELPEGFKNLLRYETIFISAKRRENINLISACLMNAVGNTALSEGTYVTNARHYEALVKTRDAIVRAKSGITDNTPADFVAQDIREALHYLGEITGNVTSDDILRNIFSKFCIGK